MKWMELEMYSHPVESIGWGTETRLEGTQLTVNQAELKDLILEDTRIGSVTFDLAFPGESVRIVHIVDVIEPRWKSEGGTIFPGFLGPGLTVGSGRTHKLSGMAIVNSAEIRTEEFIEGPGTVNGPRELIVDMAGSAAPLSPFSRTINLVIIYNPSSGVSLGEFDDAIRTAGLKAAAFLARTAVNNEPDQVTRYELSPVERRLPKVAYICQLQSHGYLRDTCLYGETIPFIEPTLLHPNELFDGAVVTASMSFASTSTYGHCNNKVVTELYRRHGKDVDFAGIVLTSYHHLTDSHKQKRAHMAAKLARLLDADGVVITQEGAGNSIVDQMVTAKFCEELGMKTVVVTYEIAGKDGRDFPLIYYTPEVDAMVSTGNREEIVHLPKVERAIGGERIMFNDAKATDSFETYLTEVAYAIDLTGFSNVRGWAY